MTDNEIIKRLERCVKRGNRNYDTDIVLDLIYRQKAEIENAKAEIKICAEVIERQDTEIERLKTAFENSQKTSKYWHKKCGELVEEIQTAQAEAIKEFAEKLKKRFYLCAGRCVVDVYNIDNLVKEYEKGR